MKETQKLKKTFNLIFGLIIAMVFVTISGFVSELYKIHKVQKELVTESIMENLISNESDLREEFYIDMDSAIRLRISTILNKKKIESYEIIKTKGNNCSNLSTEKNCLIDYDKFTKSNSSTVKSYNINDYTLIVLSINMFQTDQGKLILKIPHKYTTVSRLKYIALNILPLILIIAAWFFLFHFVEKNVISPQISKIAQYESNRKVYESIKKVTHDLRSPIEVLNQVANNIKGEEKYKELLNLSTTRVNKIINEFLEDSRQQNKELVITNISDLIEDLLTEYKFKYKNINFISISKLTNSVYFSKVDSLKLERSLSNMIQNSAESIISNGSIKIELFSIGDSFKISVQDTGIGIKDNDKKFIFKNGHTSKENGNGIGLSSTFNWIKSINGNISFQSTYGKGTTFKMLIPCHFKV